jgi:hypothetical protein
MKNVFFISFLLFAFFNSIAQKTTEIIVGKNYYGNVINEREICDWVAFSTKPDVSKAIENIVRRSGLKQNFYVMECPNTNNCFAATRNGERLIVYDPSFINKLNNVTKTDWGALSILAHEIGHHLQGHTIKKGGSEHEKETEADEFSGFVMYQMGAKLKEAQMAILSLTTEYTTSTHPPRSKRLKAIEKGYNNAKELYPDLEPINVQNSATIERPIVYDNAQTDELVIETSISPTNEYLRKKGCIDGNCFEGFGVAINSKTFEKFEGNWHMGKRHGEGAEFYKDGRKKYIGDFFNGVYNGKGTIYLKNGDRYTGGFYNGKMHGEDGVYTYRNGDSVMVNFILGKKEGKAQFIFFGGVKKTTYYKDNQEI